MTEQFGLRAEIVEKIRAVLAKFAPIKRAWIYGSRAKGDFKTGSDIDLTLVTEGDLQESFLLRVSRALDDLDLPWSFDLSLLQSIDNQSLREHIDRVGVEFFNAATYLAEKGQQEKH